MSEARAAWAEPKPGESVSDAGGLADAAYDRREEPIRSELRLRSTAGTRMRAFSQTSSRSSQRLEMMGRLAMGLAHDFNNLLAAAAGQMRLLREEVEGEEAASRHVRETLETIEAAGTLTRQMLALGRDCDEQRQAVVVDKRLRRALVLLERALGPRVQLVAELRAGDVRCSLDPLELETAILNLGLNARDAMGGVGVLRVRSRVALLAGAEVDSSSSHHVLVEVEDRGMGMAPTVANRAFEEFFTTKQPGRGTGMGLSRVREFAVGVGGSVRVRTREGLGTTVSLRLPLL